MNGLYILNLTACAVIFVWASWCALSPRVRDGVLGKIMFAMASLAALAVIVGTDGDYDRADTAEITLNVAIALLGLRHIAMKYLWPRLCRAIRCATCPHKG
ncbi:antiholin [Achromobacter phage Mano]|uniref:Antiholin n=1 Tax=Achromobacter phage Mano TaxID=2767570 RepID=A0A7L8G6D8_9CAUD|nr:holin [Achromobacter phage Mano]QOE32794.1 antiholin [Achromobacter phage Mano]